MPTVGSVALLLTCTYLNTERGPPVLDSPLRSVTITSTAPYPLSAELVLGGRAPAAGGRRTVSECEPRTRIAAGPSRRVPIWMEATSDLYQ